MTAFDAMTLGTAGFTAALAIMLMEHNGLKPDNGPVAVTGATGGVGSVAIEILAKLGYHVVAITGKAEEGDYLKGIGAKRGRAAAIARIGRRSGRSTARRSRERSTTSAAISSRGCLPRSKIGGTVASVGPGCRLQAQHHRDAVHPARRAPARRRQRQYADGAAPDGSGTSSPWNGGRTGSTTRCARSISTNCRRISIRTSRAWCGAAPWCASRPTRTAADGARRRIGD